MSNICGNLTLLPTKGMLQELQKYKDIYSVEVTESSKTH